CGNKMPVVYVECSRVGATEIRDVCTHHQHVRAVAEVHATLPSGAHWLEQQQNGNTERNDYGGEDGAAKVELVTTPDLQPVIHLPQIGGRDLSLQTGLFPPRHGM